MVLRPRSRSNSDIIPTSSRLSQHRRVEYNTKIANRILDLVKGCGFNVPLAIAGKVSTDLPRLIASAATRLAELTVRYKCGQGC
jgi:hypothetical protein